MCATPVKDLGLFTPGSWWSLFKGTTLLLTGFPKAELWSFQRFFGGDGGRMTLHSLLKSRDSLTLSRVWAQGYFEIPARPVPDSRKLPHGQKYASIVCLLPLPGSSLCLGCCCPRTQPRSLKTSFKAQALGFSSVLPFNSQSIRTGCSN